MDQITVNLYPPGAGIPSHVDAHMAFHGVILSVSLGSEAIMEFRPSPSSADGPPDQLVVSVPLPPRSLLVLSGAARYSWEHAIPQRKTDVVVQPSSASGSEGPCSRVVHRATRLSITCRSTKAVSGCRGCPCPSLCDAVSRQ